MIPTTNPLDSTKSSSKDVSSINNTPNRRNRERSSSKSPQPKQSPQKSSPHKANMIVTANHSSTFKCNLKCTKSDEETFV